MFAWPSGRQTVSPTGSLRPVAPISSNIHIVLKLPLPTDRVAGQRSLVANLTSDVKLVIYPARLLTREQHARHITTIRRCYVTKHTTSSAVMNDHIIYHGEN